MHRKKSSLARKIRRESEKLRYKTREMVPEKMSRGWIYGGFCCKYCINGIRFCSKRKHHLRRPRKAKTLRTHRDGTSYKQNHPRLRKR